MSRPLRTLHLTTVDLTAYCFLRSWFACLHRSGAEVHLACTVEQFRDPLEETGARVLALPISRELRPLEDLASLLDLVYLIRRLRPDVVHTHTSKAGFLGRLAAWLCRVPLILHTIHELPENSTDSPWRKALYRALEQVAARWATHLITVSEPNRRQILAAKICPERKLTLIREGLALERYRPSTPAAEVRRRLGIPAQAPVVGTLARLEPAKGHVYLLEAFARVLEARPDAWLVCVGGGHLRPDLEARSRDMGLAGRVVFTGFVEDVVDLVASFDVFALASLYEGLGVAILEAMALGRPTVCTAVGGVLDVVVDGETGYLVPPRDPEALARRILELLGDPEKAAAMGAAGRRRVETEFREDEANRRMLGLYRHLLERHGPWHDPEKAGLHL
ncbi:MAG TPA: glycosyltransferase family 4 protein [Candidatus Nitrosotenuis sp.]|nr:glycosyltransferase family 4 protein [Candidatus Nitrosotenuis sp.]